MHRMSWSWEVADDQLSAHRDILIPRCRIYRTIEQNVNVNLANEKTCRMRAMTLAFLQRKGFPGGLTMLRGQTELPALVRSLSRTDRP